MKTLLSYTYDVMYIWTTKRVFYLFSSVNFLFGSDHTLSSPVRTVLPPLNSMDNAQYLPQIEINAPQQRVNKSLLPPASEGWGEGRVLTRVSVHRGVGGGVPTFQPMGGKGGVLTFQLIADWGEGATYLPADRG